MAQTKRQRLRRISSVRSRADFAYQNRHFQRPNLVVEGDSWFDYPRKWTQRGNIIDHIQSWTRGKANFLRLESNGDEATQMLSSEQRHKLTELLHDAATKSSLRPVDALLFSAGGNDVVGDWDLPRFLHRFRPGMSAEQCIRTSRLKQKLKQVELAYLELLTIRDHYSPSTVVITHTYDRVIPSDVGVKLPVIGNVAGPWIKPHLDDLFIPPVLHEDVARILLSRLRTMLLDLQERASVTGFVVVDTHGTVGRNQWRNEIHPTPKGFEKVAKKVYAELRRQVAGLPAP